MGFSAGFTLIEMLVVFSLLFTFSTVGMASYVQFTNNQSLDASVGEFNTILNTARMRAVSQVIPAAATSCAGQTLKGYQVNLTPWGRDYEIDILCGGNVVVLNKHKLSDNICFNSSSNTPVVFNVADGTTRPAAITINGVDKSEVISVDNAGNVSVSQLPTSAGCSATPPTSTPVPINTPVPTDMPAPIPTNTPTPMPTNYEAEYATLAGPIVDTLRSGYSGTGYADYQAASGEYIQWTVNVSTAGSYDLKFRYANGGTGDRPLELLVNGVVISNSLSFPVTGVWTSWTFVSKSAVLNSGTNTVRLTDIGSSGGNIDYLELALTPTPTPTSTPTPTPAGGIVSGQVYRLINQCGNKALDVAGNSTVDGANVHQWTWYGLASQQWKIESASAGYYKLTAQHSGKVLDVAGVSTADGANVQQWTWSGSGGANQQWRIVDLGGGFYQLLAKHSGKALDVQNGSTADGANVQQWTSNTSSCNQKWEIF